MTRRVQRLAVCAATLVVGCGARSRLVDEQVKPWTSDVDPRSPATVAIVRSVLAQLPADEAQASVYYHLDGMSHAEIAGVMACSRRHVGDLLERAAAGRTDHRAGQPIALQAGFGEFPDDDQRPARGVDHGGRCDSHRGHARPRRPESP